MRYTARMRTKMTLAGMALMGVLVGLLMGTTVQAQRIMTWQPFRVLLGTPLYDNSRYWINYIHDEDAPETCIVAVTDTENGHFAITAVPRASCDARRTSVGMQ